MNRRLALRKVCVACCAAIILAVAAAASAADFRVDNSVFAADKQEPIAQSITLFQGGVVYDFLRRPPELIVYDTQAEMFTLLDPQRKVRTALSKADLAAFCQQLRRWAENQRDPVIRFSANPQFELQFDPTRSSLSASSTWISYRVEGRRAEDPEMLRQYTLFADGSAQINALLNPGSRLPFPRLALNEHLARRAILPEQVDLTISSTSKNGQKQTTLRSQHRWSTTLTDADLQRIREVRHWLVGFQPVPINQYLKAEHSP